MQFESKYGLGEIVCRDIVKNGKLVTSEMFEVIAVSFALNGEVNYQVRLPNGLVSGFMECELSGDPDFDQKIGYKNADYEKNENSISQVLTD